MQRKSMLKRSFNINVELRMKNFFDIQTDVSIKIKKQSSV